MLKAGDKAPDFCLPDQNGRTHCLEGYLKEGKTVVLYFYPKDDTPGCTCEGKEFTAILGAFQNANSAVFGISTDSVESHSAFCKKYGLNVTLLSDGKKEVVGKYGVWGKKSFMGKEYEGTHRTTFVIGRNGRIMFVFDQVKPEGHAEEVLQKVRK